MISPVSFKSDYIFFKLILVLANSLRLLTSKKYKINHPKITRDIKLTISTKTISKTLYCSIFSSYYSRSYQSSWKIQLKENKNNFLRMKQCIKTQRRIFPIFAGLKIDQKNSSVPFYTLFVFISNKYHDFMPIKVAAIDNYILSTCK